MDQNDSAGVLLSATPGIGSFVTLTFIIGNSQLIVWLYQCYWELKDENGNVILTSEDSQDDLRNNQVWEKIIGSKIKQLTTSPELFEIILEKYSVVCIASENKPDEDRIGARIYLANTHVMDVHLS